MKEKEKPEPKEVVTVACAVCRCQNRTLRKVRGLYYCEPCIKEIVKCYS